MTEDIKNVKAEIDIIKSQVSSLSDIQTEGNVIINTIKTLKEDIQNIKEENVKICEKIKLLKEEFEGSDSEKSLCDEGENI